MCVSLSVNLDLDALWDYNDPAGSEVRFRAKMPETEAAGDAAPLAELLTQLARSQGLQKKCSESHATLDRAEGLLAAGSSRARARLLLERGRAFNSGGDKTRAKPLFQEALAVAESANEEFHAVDALHMLAVVEEGETALAANRRAIERAERCSSEQARGWLGSLLNNTGWSLHDLGRFEEALEIFLRAQTFREVQGKPGAIRIAKWCVARCLRSLGRNQEAVEIQRTLKGELERSGEKDPHVDEELEILLRSVPEPTRAPAAVAPMVALLFASVLASCGGPQKMPGDRPDRGPSKGGSPYAMSAETPAESPTEAEGRKLKPSVTPAILFAEDGASFKRKLPDDLPSVVEFMDPGCHNCQMIRPFFEELTTRYAGQIRVYTVDIRRNEGLAREYGISFTPTFMVFAAGGKPITRDLVSGIVQVEELFRKALPTPEPTPTPED